MATATEQREAVHRMMPRKPRDLRAIRRRGEDPQRFNPRRRTQDPAYAGKHRQHCAHCEEETTHESWDARSATGSDRNHLDRALWWTVCTVCNTSTDLC